MRLKGFEPLTFGSVDRRSIQLSYRRKAICDRPLRNLARRPAYDRDPNTRCVWAHLLRTIHQTGGHCKRIERKMHHFRACRRPPRTSATIHPAYGLASGEVFGFRYWYFSLRTDAFQVSLTCSSEALNGLSVPRDLRYSSFVIFDILHLDTGGAVLAGAFLSPRTNGPPHIGYVDWRGPATPHRPSASNPPILYPLAQPVQVLLLILASEIFAKPPFRRRFCATLRNRDHRRRKPGRDGPCCDRDYSLFFAISVVDMPKMGR